MTSSNLTLSSPGRATEPFWPAGQTRLRLCIEDRDNQRIARGHDPDSNALVFEATLRTDQEADFVQAVSEARQLEKILPRPVNDNVGVNVVVITGPDTGDGPGPKYHLDLPANQQSAAVAVGAR